MVDYFSSLDEEKYLEQKSIEVNNFWEVGGQNSTFTFERVLQPIITIQPNVLISRSSKFKIQKNIEIKISNNGLVEITNNFFETKGMESIVMENSLSDMRICSGNSNKINEERKGTL